MNAYQEDFGDGEADSYFLKISPTFDLLFLTCLGGNGTDRCWDARLMPSDNIVLVGRTSSENYPTLNATYLELTGNYDAFATEMASDGQDVVRSGLFGGLLEDIGEGIAIDDEGDVVISGRAASSTLPLNNAFQEEYGGSRDVFVCHTIFDEQSTGTQTNTTPTDATTPNDVNVGFVLGIIGGACIILAICVIIVLKRRE